MSDISPTLGPWAAEDLYPVSANPWSATATKVVPNYDIFTPGVPPTAQELNATIKDTKQGVALIPSVVLQQFCTPFVPAGGKPVVTGFFDEDTQIWFYITSNGTDSNLSHTIDGGLTQNPFGAIVSMSSKVALDGAASSIGALVQNDTLSSDWMFVSKAGVKTFTASNGGTVASVLWFPLASRFLSITALQTGGNVNGGAAWTADGTTYNNDSASLPAAWFTSVNHVDALLKAASSNMMMFGASATNPASDINRLMSVTWNGAAFVYTDITPNFLTIAGTDFRGLSYNHARGLWGVLVAIAGPISRLYTSKDGLAWTIESAVGADLHNLACLGDCWVSSFNSTYYGTVLDRLVCYDSYARQWNYTHEFTTGGWVNIVASKNDVMVLEQAGNTVSISRRIGNIG